MLSHSVVEYKSLPGFVTKWLCDLKLLTAWASHNDAVPYFLTQVLADTHLYVWFQPVCSVWPKGQN